MSDLTTVATFTFPYEANLLKGRLETEGITCSLANENIVTVNPFYSNAVGGVQLQVRKQDQEKALAIIAETNKAGNTFSGEMPSDEEIAEMPREPVVDSKIMRLLGWVFGKNPK